MFRLCLESLIYWIKFLNETTVGFPLTSSWSVNCSHLGNILGNSYGSFTLHGTGWVSILCYVQYTLHRDRYMEQLFSIVLIPFPVHVPVPVPCSVSEPLKPLLFTEWFTHLVDLFNDGGMFWIQIPKSWSKLTVSLELWGNRLSMTSVEMRLDTDTQPVFAEMKHC